jgi:hypothetical protein
MKKEDPAMTRTCSTERQRRRPASRKFFAGSLLLLLPCGSSFSQQSPRRAGLSSGDHAAALSELNRFGEDPRLFSKASLLREFSAEQLDRLLDQGNRLLQAAAISQMAQRRDPTSRAKVQRIFDAGIPPEGGQRLDSRAAMSPYGIRFLAAVTFVAATERRQSIPKILGRPETWQMPWEVSISLRAAGPGWIDAALKESSEGERLKAIGAMIANGATSENLDEVAGILMSRHEDPLWRGALVACERLDSPACWQALGRTLDARGPVDRLRAGMAAFRKGRGSEERLLEAASRLVVHASGLAPGPELAGSLIALHEFQRLAESRNVPAPEGLVRQMQAPRNGPGIPMPAGDRSGGSRER